MKTLVGWIITAGVFACGAYLGHLADLGVITQDDIGILIMPVAFVGLILLGLTGNLYKED